MSKYFVAGTDTDVGKTLISCGLLHLVSVAGGHSLGLKPLAAGADKTDEGWRNTDALMLQKHSSIKLAYESVNPVLLQQAAAPHLAADAESRQLSAQRLAGFCRGAMLQKNLDMCLVEGAGGWLVPLNPRETMEDLAVQLNLPVILVVGLRLGCLNHALLSQRAIEKSGLRLAAWVATQLDDDMPLAKENFASLEARIQAPCLGYIPYLDKPAPEIAAKFLDITNL